MTTEASAIGRAKVKPRVKRNERLRAPFSLRCGALLIDYILVVSILAFSTLVSRMLGGGARTAGASFETVGIVMALAIAVVNLGILPGFTGMTLGKWATGLRIERKDGSPINVGRAFLRHFVGYPLSFVTLGVGFAISAFSSRGRTLHDLISDTIVIREGLVVPQRSR